MTFHVPVPPLVVDTTLVTNPGSFGFEVTDEGAPALAIASVALSGPDAVKIVLNRAPAGAARLRYAHTGTLNASSGPTTGPRGNLRDSDATPSRSGEPLYDWCIHFDEALP